MHVIKKNIGRINNQDILEITFINDNNFEITFYNYGGYIHSILIPYIDNLEKREDVLLGYGNLTNCLEAPDYFNSIIGRVANRISNSQFEINNQKYFLSKNMENNHLHGGINGFNKKIWKINNINKSESELSCELEYLSKHLEEGYPGNLNLTVKYIFNNRNEFSIEFAAISDQDTLVNLTNHNYWNFHGHGQFYQNIINHSVKIYSEKYCENNEDSIPTGNLIDVINTKFDFINHKNISSKLLKSGGIDHNYELINNSSKKIAAEIFSNLTRMGVTYFTDQPGIQFYTGNMMTSKYIGKKNKKYGIHHGLCLEPQFFPNAINQKNFKSPILKKGKKYNANIIMKLGNNF